MNQFVNIVTKSSRKKRDYLITVEEVHIRNKLPRFPAKNGQKCAIYMRDLSY